MLSADNGLNNPPGFFARLKQHHIYQVMTVYAIAAWIPIQASNFMFPDFGLPRSDVRAVSVGLALLFPVVLIITRLLDTIYPEPLTTRMLRIDPVLDPIRNDPRFQAPMKKYSQQEQSQFRNTGAPSN